MSHKRFLNIILAFSAFLLNYISTQGADLLNDSTIEKKIKKASDYLCVNLDSSLSISQSAYKDAIFLGNDKVTADALYQLGLTNKALRKFNKAIYYHAKALKIRRKLKINKDIARSLNALGNTFSEMGNYSKALIFFKHSYYIKKLENDNKGAATTLYNIGNVYLGLSQFNKSLYYYEKALSVFDSIRYDQGKASCFNSLGIVYETLEEYDKALSFYNQSLKIEAKKQNYSGMINAYNNIGNIYSHGGFQQNAFEYYSNALKYSEMIGDTENIANALKNIGLIYTIQANYNAANTTLLKAVKLSKQISRTELEINVFHAIGYSYTFQGKCDSAVFYLNKSLDEALSIGYENMVIGNYMMLAHAYMCTGNSAKAFEFYQKYMRENDKSVNELGLLKQQLANEKQAAKINLEQNRNKIILIKIRNERIYYILSLGILLLLGVIIILILQKRSFTLKYKNLELQQKLLQVQMNPHFIYNTLASIEGSLYKNSPEEVSAFISDFSHLFRNILESSRKEFIPLQSELKMLEQYIRLQKLRYGEIFSCYFYVDSSIDTDAVCLPPMIIQPFIENAIEHAFSGVNYKGQIKVVINKSEHYLNIEICDNGIGFSNKKSSSLPKKDFASLSHTIIGERLKFMSHGRAKFGLEIEDFPQPPNSTGTNIKLNVPYKLIHQL